MLPLPNRYWLPPCPPCRKQVARLPAAAAAADAGASAAHQRACPCCQGCRCSCAIAATAKLLKHVGFDRGTGVFSTNPSTHFSDGSTIFQMVCKKWHMTKLNCEKKTTNTSTGFSQNVGAPTVV